MLTINALRENLDKVKKGVIAKKYKHPEYVDFIAEDDKQKKKLQLEYESLANELNECAKQVGRLLSEKKEAEAAALKEYISEKKDKRSQIAKQIDVLSEAIYQRLIELPNLPLEEVPAGNSPEHNQTVKQSDTSHLSDKTSFLPHWEIARKYDIIDFETGSLVTGSGFPFFKGAGALLQRKLVEYFLDFNRQAGYVEYQTPILVNEQSAFSTGQLPDKEGQMYYIAEDRLYLIPTAEVSLTNIYRNKIVPQKDLPIKLTGYTPCFRREAGSYGKDVRGLNRLHQFDKVEIVQIVEPEHARNVLDEMALHVEKLIQSLELPYRILKLCDGDMGFASALTFDFEVYSVGQKKWLEASSVSLFGSFQSNRLSLRYKKKNSETVLLHTLNGSSLALPRIIAALLEYHQTDEGIKIPQALIPYMKTNIIS